MTDNKSTSGCNGNCRSCKIVDFMRISFIVLCVFVIACAVVYGIYYENEEKAQKPISPTEMEELELWVQNDYPISEEITEAYQSDGCISVREFQAIEIIVAEHQEAITDQKMADFVEGLQEKSPELEGDFE